MTSSGKLRDLTTASFTFNSETFGRLGVNHLVVPNDSTEGFVYTHMHVLRVALVLSAPRRRCSLGGLCPRSRCWSTGRGRFCLRSTRAAGGWRAWILRS